MGKRRWPKCKVHPWPGEKGKRVGANAERMRSAVKRACPVPGCEQIPDLRLLYDLEGLMRVVGALYGLAGMWDEHPNPPESNRPGG